MLHVFNAVKLCYFDCLKYLIGLIRVEEPIARQEKGQVELAGQRE